MAYKFIYFDLDDTLLDHRSAERAALLDVHAHFSLFKETNTEALIDIYHQVNSMQWAQYSGGEISRQELQRNRFEQTLEKLNLDSSDYARIGQYYIACYRNHWQWIEGAEALYQRVVQKYPVGILTNGFAETQRKKLDDFGLYRSAEHVVISEDVGALKPDPKVFEYATRQTGLDKNDILYVGDSYRSDIEGATNFGWDTAWFTQNGDSAKQKKAQFVFSDFNDLSNYIRI
ncbi:YjjG family noncanonical pyrimidine nucleotidase [Fodinibius salsisoli]|uniref:YjjG family noncanonical pyrimidine nucleotidase n=1 Tax=Fodinibius salsisoli TaxID=2820877 RepID=UPI0022483C16|nr:YjjG family noncanonical pyrimidine nucleotidase [Fodinibius salsisoli]